MRVCSAVAYGPVMLIVVPSAHTLDYLISVPDLLSVPADKFPKISVRLLDRE